jgi:hypothetical protein
MAIITISHPNRRGEGEEHVDVYRKLATAAERGQWVLTDAERRECVEQLLEMVRTARGRKVRIYAIRALALLDGLNVKREGHNTSREVNAHADAARVLASLMAGQGAALLGTLTPPSPAAEPITAPQNATPDANHEPTTGLVCGRCEGAGFLAREGYAGTCDLCHGACYLHGPVSPL